MKPEVHILPNPKLLAQSAAEMILSAANQAIAARGRFSISLSGGSTPKSLYALLAQPEYAHQLDWTKGDIFWGDERCVPPDHPDSDYWMAKDSLLDKIPSMYHPTLYRMEGETDPGLAADRYQSLLQTYFGPEPQHTFDILLLGMGDDGHTASLFPGTAPIFETHRWVIGHYVPKLSSWRITLTPPILNKSRLIIFLVAGKSKAATLKNVLNAPPDPALLPSQIIQPENGRLIWLVDQAASAETPDLVP